MRVVCDSSIIIALSSIRRLDILWKLFDEVLVPEAVYQEVCVKGGGRVGSEDLKVAIELGKIKLVKIGNTLMVESLVDPLGHGEAESIVVGIEQNADFVCLDDKLARKKAKQLGIKIKGTIGLLWMALRKGIITPNDFENYLRQLIDFGFRIPKNLIQKYIRTIKNSKNLP